MVLLDVIGAVEPVWRFNKETGDGAELINNYEFEIIW